MNHDLTVNRAWLEYRKQLLAYICAKVDSYEDAEDILDDVFSSLIKAVNHKKYPTRIGPWLYHVSKNRIVDYYRAKKRFEPLLDNVAQEQKQQVNAIQSISKCMIPMIRELPENYQHAMMLSEIEEHKYKDVATQLGITLSAVKSRILRGRKLLYGNILACCELKHDRSGGIIDYELKPNNTCRNCS